jgi:hypothetical protein
MTAFDPDAFLEEKDDFDPDAFLAGDTLEEPKPQGPTIDAGSSAILKGTQGILGGYLDELSGGIEALGSVFGVEGLGGPTGNIRREQAPRTLAQAYEEGQRRKQQMLDTVQQERPTLATTAELVGGVASGAALPALGATSTLGRMGVGAGLSGFAGAGYAEGDLGDKLIAGAEAAPIGAIIPGALGGASKIAQTDTAKKLGTGAVKTFGRIATTMPEELTERYIQRGRFMDKSDNLIKVAEDIPQDLNKLLGQTRQQSMESRNILEAEGVRVPRFEIVRRLRELISSADPNNTSNSPVLAKLKERLGLLMPKDGNIGQVAVEGARPEVIQTTQRSFVGGAPKDLTAPRNVYGLPASEAKGVQKTLEGLQEVDLPANRVVIAPTRSDVVFTEPGYKPPDQLTGGQVKDIVQDVGELIEKLGDAEPGFKKTSGYNLANRSYGSIQEPIKQASPAYTAKMKEISDRMEVLKAARERFGAPEDTFNKLRLIGGNQERGHWARQDLNALEGVMGGDYTNRIKDAITLDAFTKPGVQGSRAVNLGRAAGGTVGGKPGEAIGAGIGATADFYGRSILKKGIDLQRRIQYMPPQYKASFDNAMRRGGNAAAVMHHTLFSKDPEYRRMMQEMDEQESQ